MWSICNKFKTKFLNLVQVKLLPDEIKNSVDNLTFTNTIERNGGILQIIPLIMAVTSGISALASAGGATASAFISAKNSAEDERHYRELEKIVGLGQSDSVNILKHDNNLQTIVPLIIGVLPDIIKTMPEAANKIKHLINGEVIKIDEPKVLSDNKLIDQSIEFLQGKGYDVSM